MGIKIVCLQETDHSLCILKGQRVGVLGDGGGVLGNGGGVRV